MRIIIVGPGRAGMSLATAAAAAGHRIVAVVGKDLQQAAPAAKVFGAEAATTAGPLPPADLLVIATRDGAIGPVADKLASTATDIGAAVHVSGLTPVDVLAKLAGSGVPTGSFHPLQTLPTPEAGAARLEGAWIAVTAAEPLRSVLHGLAESLGAQPFDLADDDKAIYHAAAAAAANFPLAALVMAQDLFGAAGVPFAAAKPLVEAVVANAFSLGPRPSLTGPVARGDVETVRHQLEAVASVAPQWLSTYSALALFLARIAGRGHEFEALLAEWQPGQDDDE
jgi:predicted short-subunit dehydrogenase-like oxidoreductase (DUF2520 family)